MAETNTQAQSASTELEVAPEGGGKVALDIDDAPFLKEEEPEAPDVPDEDEPPALEPGPSEAKEQPKKSKKKLIIAAAALLLLVGGGGAGWWFFLRTPPPPPPPPIAPEVIKVPTPEKPTAPAEFVLTFAPFWVELPDEKGGVVFLVCKFAAITGDERVGMEAQNKMVTMRDAMYYYLKNKSYAFLTNADNVNTIKSDLTSVLNGYLSGGKIEDMLFESYLGR